MYRFYSTCVGWPSQHVNSEGGLCDMIDAGLEISRRTFLEHVDRAELRELEADLGYATHYTQGMTMAADWHVCYKRSTLNGNRVYYFVHSAIEYVFVPEDFSWK